MQDTICSAIEQADEKGIFHEDLWQHKNGGGGRSRNLQNANIIEKGGVNFSAVHGLLPDKIAGAFKLETGHDYFATGVSVVMHPFSPMVPIIHMNVRYIEISSGQKWFGGGIDLTPIYINREQAKKFHLTLKDVCDRHNPAYYNEFKTWADNYFFIPHRNETRGIGGIFFDRLENTNKTSLENNFAFVQDVAKSFAPAYIQIMKHNKDIAYGKNEKKWQMIRRGRYVEFNLLYDKGTKFGLDTEGRTESVFMSLPPEAKWPYDFKPTQGSDEEFTQSLLRKNIDWINF